jgi:hypothetical protein
VNRSTLRIAIIVLTLITAIVHLGIALLHITRGEAGGLDYVFLGNGIGYIALLAALFADVPYFRDHRDIAHWLLIAFAGITLIGFFALNISHLTEALLSPPALISKTAELLLIIATFLHMRAS